MLLLFRVGAIQVMSKHVQLKGNVYYYRRRVPEDVRSLHRHPGDEEVPGSTVLQPQDLAKA